MRRSAPTVAAYVLLALPVAGLLWVPLYGGPGPSLAGLPFFYWYQFAWVGLSAALMALSRVLLLRRSHRDPAPRRPAGRQS
jgi:hypothetical protein